MKKGIILIVWLLGIAQLFSYQVGEKLTFDIKYGFIKAAKAVLAVDSVSYDSTTAVQVSAKTNTYSFFDSVFKVRDEIKSIIDPESKLPHEFIKKLKEGNYRQHRVHVFMRDEKLTMYRKWKFKHKIWKEKYLEIPADTHDMFSAFYWSRQQDMAPGDTLSLTVTADGVTAPIKIICHKREKIDTIFGEVRCLKIEPIVDGETIFANSGRVFIWLTDDEEKIPVLLESKIIFGSFRAILRNAKNVIKRKK